jgi:hypothetical protein
MRSLKAVLSRVNQLAERAQAAANDGTPAQLVAILLQGRQHARTGHRPDLPSDDELRQRARTRAEATLIERLIAGRRRLERWRNERPEHQSPNQPE